MATKAECMKLADELGMSIDTNCYGVRGLVYGDWQVGLPSGYQVEIDGSMMTGFSGGTHDGTWAKVWTAIYRDMQQLINAGEWVLVPEVPQPTYSLAELQTFLADAQAQLKANDNPYSTEPLQSRVNLITRKIAELTA
jgi:hypothetical protein